ncbi:MAG: PD-(D/E)XK nuclease family transposase, partial [Treponema sp.]|nr:PD-(D/E)XK nuclease family transposase [Treponema sp.]
MYISKKEIREKMQREKLLDPLSDATFKALFADESPEGNYCLSKLLESIIGREISDIKILKNEPSGSEREKPVRFDISCTFNDGEEAEIEVQTHRMNDNFINRSVYYMIRGHRDRLNKGQKYNRLKRYYQINITDFNVIKNDSLLNHFQLRNTEGI